MSAVTALLLALPGASPSLVTAAPPRAGAVPATSWACTFDTPDRARFRLSGRLGEIPAGWDSNRSRDTGVAAGLCTSDFDARPASERPQP